MDTNLLLLPWIFSMNETNTGGGGYIGNDANTRNFTGRDEAGNRVEVNLGQHDYQRTHPMSLAGRIEELEDAVRLLKQDVYGSSQSGISGVIRNQSKQLHLSQVNMTLNVLTLLVFVVYAYLNWAA
jgi:hypothetical protein